MRPAWLDAMANPASGGSALGRGAADGSPRNTCVRGAFLQRLWFLSKGSVAEGLVCIGGTKRLDRTAGVAGRMAWTGATAWRAVSTIEQSVCRLLGCTGRNRLR